MPKITKIEDKTRNLKPLRVTQTKARRLSACRTKAASTLIRCGCCNEGVRIYLGTNAQGEIETLEINGVEGTREQWREALSSIL